MLNFIKNANIGVIQKSLISYAYIQLVKPFNDYNEEISVLVAKAVLAHCAYGEPATLVNLEIIEDFPSISPVKYAYFEIL